MAGAGCEARHTVQVASFLSDSKQRSARFWLVVAYAIKEPGALVLPVP